MIKLCKNKTYFIDTTLDPGKFFIIMEPNQLCPENIYSYLINFIDTIADRREIEFKIEDNDVIDVGGVTKQVFSNLGIHIKSILKTTKTGRYLLEPKEGAKLRQIDARVIGKLVAMSINEPGYKINVPFSYGVLNMLEIGNWKPNYKDEMSYSDYYQANMSYYNMNRKHCMDLTLYELMYAYYVDNGADDMERVIQTFIEFKYKGEDQTDEDYFVNEILASDNYAFEFFRSGKDSAPKYKYNPTDKYEWLRQHLFYELIHQHHEAILLFITGFKQLYHETRYVNGVINSYQQLDELISAPAVNLQSMQNLKIVPYASRNMRPDVFNKMAGYMRRFISEGKLQTQAAPSEEDKQEFWENLLVFITAQADPTANIVLDTTMMDGKHVAGDDGAKPTRLPEAHTCFNRLDLPDYSKYEFFAQAMTTAMANSGSGFSTA